MAHNYILPICLIYSDYDIPVVMYDQIGCGESTLFPKTRGDTKFWTYDLFMDELKNFTDALEIKTFDLLGQSWGGMLGSQYAATKQPKGLRKLILCNSPASMFIWSDVNGKLVDALPERQREILKRCERDGTTDSKEYEEATEFFYHQHLCRVDPFPDEIEQTFAAIKNDDTVYLTMNGPSEFTVVGVIKDWTIIDRLRAITPQTAPGGVLLINGHYDEAQDEVVWPFFNKIEARVKWIKFALSSHTPMLEETEAFIKALGEFLEQD